MNEASEQRLALTKKIAIAYIANPNVKAIGVAGSVARGQAEFELQRITQKTHLSL